MTEYNTIHLEDGYARIFENGNVNLLDFDGKVTHRFGQYDLIELTRRACATDSNLLRKLAQIMEKGHRFRDDELDGYSYDPDETVRPF